MNWLWTSLYHALAMGWMTFWALVLGFCVSAALQIFVSKEQMTRAFGQTNLKSVAVATGLGAASSSCSYAAAAAGRSAIRQGAALVPALAFMFASTNLVIELGVVLWILMGWPFVLAEFVGAFVLIGLVWLMVKFVLPKSVQDDLRPHAERESGDDSHCCHGDEHEHDHHDAAGGASKWQAMADAFVMDWAMLWKELLGGFVIAGFIATLVPADWWQTLFLQNGPAPLRLIENAIVGPIIAILSFVCSVGNIPLASHLWASGIGFGGVIAFIYADLLVVPLILIYGKYYGARAAAWICGIFFVAMVVAGIVVDLLFGALGFIPMGPRPPSAVAHEMIHWNYTSWLDLIAAIVFASMFYLHYRARIKVARARMFEHLSNPEYLHTLINPLPVYGLALGFVSLILALISRARSARMIALVLVFISAISVWPAAHYGDAAKDRVLTLADVDGGKWLEEHEARADKLIPIFYVIAALSVIALAAERFTPRAAVSLSIATALLTLAALGAGAYIAAAGGRIRHREFRYVPPPSPAESTD